MGFGDRGRIMDKSGKSFELLLCGSRISLTLRRTPSLKKN